MRMLILLLLGLTGAQQISTPPSLAEFHQSAGLNRRGVMRRLDISALRSPEQALPLIQAGLADADSVVRLLASSALRNVQAAVESGATKLTLPEELLDLLEQRLQDSVSGVRGNCMSALVYFGEHRKVRTARRLADGYASENDPVLRSFLVSNLRRLDPEAKLSYGVIRTALGDPSPHVRNQAALALRARPDPSSLPRIVEELRSGDEKTRSAFVAALEAYGAQGKQHLDLLQSLHAREYRPVIKEQIWRTIQNLQNSK